MRLIGLLLALLAVGWLVMTQLQSTPTPSLSAEDSAGTAVQATQPQVSARLSRRH